MRKSALLLGLMSACEPDVVTQETPAPASAPVEELVQEDQKYVTPSCFYTKPNTSSRYTDIIGEIYASPIPNVDYVMDPCKHLSPQDEAACREEVDAEIDKEERMYRDPVIVKLSKEFKKEANRQLKVVQDAGGYCELPAITKAKNRDFDENKPWTDSWTCQDNRLGNNLVAITNKRDERFKKLKEDPNSAFSRTQIDYLPPWIAELGRAECEPVQEIPGLPYLSDEIDEFNALCAESKGGLFTNNLVQNPYALHQLLVRRGQEIMAHTDPAEQYDARAAWVNMCSPDSTPEALTPLEEQQFLGSIYPMKMLNKAGWYCPADDASYVDNDKLLYGNMERDECGRVTECVLDPEEADSNGKKHQAHKHVVTLPN